MYNLLLFSSSTCLGSVSLPQSKYLLTDHVEITTGNGSVQKLNLI